MAAEIRYAAEVEQDLDSGFAWYESRDAGLGDEFLRAVQARISAVARTPEAHQVIYETYRRAVVRRFPFVIIYEYADGVVTVYSVFHTSQDPNKWRERLP